MNNTDDEYYYDLDRRCCDAFDKLSEDEQEKVIELFNQQFPMYVPGSMINTKHLEWWKRYFNIDQDDYNAAYERAMKII